MTSNKICKNCGHIEFNHWVNKRLGRCVGTRECPCKKFEEEKEWPENMTFFCKPHGWGAVECKSCKKSTNHSPESDLSVPLKETEDTPDGDTEERSHICTSSGTSKSLSEKIKRDEKEFLRRHLMRLKRNKALDKNEKDIVKSWIVECFEGMRTLRQLSNKTFIQKLKEGEEAMKETIHYKSNNLDYKVGMIHGFEFLMNLIKKRAGDELLK